MLLIVLTLLLALLYIFLHEPVPSGKEGPEAEHLADKMLSAVNFQAWDSTVAVRWSFGDHDYLWDKKRKLVQVAWDDYCIQLCTQSQEGVACENKTIIHGDEKSDVLQKAWRMFVNDSFWLAAPFKIRDPGTQRTLVESATGNALLVHYSSGGVTPGDTYLWILDEDGTPVAWKLWVRIIPIGGVRFSWENWHVYSTGARIATFHDGIMDVAISDVKLGMSAEEINAGVDPFEDFPENCHLEQSSTN